MIYLNDESYPIEFAKNGKLCPQVAKKYGKSSFIYKTAEFIEEFYNDKPYVEVLTSGSTGKPKCIHADKQRMLSSAAMTVAFLQLKEQNTALLCMPLEHIAGKMVVVRALHKHLKIIAQEPTANPFAKAPQGLHFAAVTPMQAYCALEDAHSREVMASCRKIIIGGGFIDKNLYDKLLSLPNEIYHSYGMTETLSHIALKRINKDNNLFKPLPGVTIELSPRGTLVIEAPQICPMRLETNDIAEITKDGFIIKGRIDNVINSGGIKLIPEEIEAKLSQVIKTAIAVTARKSAKYGEEVILISEEKLNEDLLNKACQMLHKYEKPKAVITHKIPLTATNKINRAQLKALFYKK